MTKFNKQFWNKLSSIKIANKTKEQNNDKKTSNNSPKKSTEALGDVADETPPGGEPTDDTAPPEEDAGDVTTDEGGGDDMDMGGMDFGGDDFGMGGEGGDSGGSDTSSAPASAPPPSLENRETGENPFASSNGRELLLKHIQELASGIDLAIDAISKVPKISSVVVNDFVDLKDMVSKLIDIVYTVPLEETIVRYKLCVQAYQTQVSVLSTEIKQLISTEDK